MEISFYKLGNFDFAIIGVQKFTSEMYFNNSIAFAYLALPELP